MIDSMKNKLKHLRQIKNVAQNCPLINILFFTVDVGTVYIIIMSNILIVEYTKQNNIILLILILTHKRLAIENKIKKDYFIQ